MRNMEHIPDLENLKDQLDPEEILRLVEESQPVLEKFFARRDAEAKFAEEGKKRTDRVVAAARARISRRSFLKILGAGAILATLFPSDVLARPEEKKKEVELLKKRELADVLGEKLQAVFEKNGFEPTLDIESDDDSYVVHFPQLHRTGDVEEDKKHRHAIVTWQKSIEQCLLDAQKESDSFGFVFSEGIDKEMVGSLSILHLWKCVVDQTDDWTRLLKMAKQLHSYQKGMRELFYYIFTPRFKELEQKSKMSEKEDSEEAQAHAELRRMLFEGGEVSNDDDIYMLGAETKMAIDGTAVIFAAETAEANDEALRVLGSISVLMKQAEEQLKKDMQDAGNDLMKLESAFKKFGQADEESRKLSNRFIIEDREKIALDLITARQTTGKKKFLPIIFGAAHDFSNNVRDLNKQNVRDPNKGRKGSLGLIELRFRRQQEFLNR